MYIWPENMELTLHVEMVKNYNAIGHGDHTDVVLPTRLEMVKLWDYQSLQNKSKS